MLSFAKRNSFIKSVLAVLFCFPLSVNAIYAQTLTDKIDRYVQARLAKSSIPGLAIAVVHNDTLLLSKGYGVTSANLPILSNTPFAIASLSKAFTAMAIMQLVDEGRLSLDDSVVRHFPSFASEDKRGKSITIRQLLHQTSGLADTGFPELAFRKQPATLDEDAAQIKRARLVSEPGEQYHYHNPNYRLLAKIVETISHEPFADYLKNHIFKPLKMYNTSDVSATKSLYLGKNRIEKGHIFFLGKPISIQEPDWFIDGAAGMRSTADDMAHWLSAQLADGRVGHTQLVSRQSMSMMHNPPLRTSFSYGMGWILGEDSSLYHSGILWTYSAEQLLLTKDGYGVIVLFNSGINPYVDYNSFLQGISDIIKGQEPELPSLPDYCLPVIVGFIMMVFIGLTIRRFLRFKHWSQTLHERSFWRSLFFLTFRVLCVVIFLSIPLMLTAISGRVLNWIRIFLMMPDVILSFGLIVLLNFIIVITRLVYLLKLKGIVK